MNYGVQNNGEAKTVDSQGIQQNEIANRAKNVRHEEQRDSSGSNWAWAGGNGHYDWMDSHTPFAL